MANRPAEALALREGDRERLASLMRSSSVRAGLSQRARIVLLAADGLSNTAIAQRVGVSRPTVIGWRSRYDQRGITGLVDEPRSGRPRTIDHRDIVAATLKANRQKTSETAHYRSPSRRMSLIMTYRIIRMKPEPNSMGNDPAKSLNMLASPT